MSDKSCKYCQGTGELRGYGGPAERCECATTDDFDVAMVERLQTIAFNLVAFSNRGAMTQLDIKALLRALPLSAAALNALEAGEAVVAPKYATVAMQRAVALDQEAWASIHQSEVWTQMLAASPYDKETKDG